jgi:adenylate cyclase
MAGGASSDRARLSRKALQGLLIGLGASALAVTLGVLGLLDAFEGRTWDLRVQLLARPGKATSEVVLILLDQGSLDWGREVNGLSWPWPRETCGIMADFCRRGGARALALDMLFLEPSGYGVYDDQSFAAALAGNGSVVGTVFMGRKQGGTESWPEGVPEPGLSVTGLEAWLASSGSRAREALTLTKATFPIPELSGSARLLANTYLTADRADGVYRRGQLFNLFDGRVVPSLALGTYLAGNPGGHDLRIERGRIVVDGRAVPIDRLGRAVLNFRGPTLTHRSYSAAAVLQSELQILAGEQPALDPQLLQGRYVLFGSNAPGVLDLRPAPVDKSYPGVEINATMLDNLLSGDFLRPLPWAAAAAIVLLLAGGAGLMGSLASGAGRSALAYVLFLPLAPALSLGAYALGYWLPLVSTELAVAVTLAGSSVVNYATEGRQKRYIKSAFRQYLSPEVIEELIAHPERLKLGGERRELSIFFSDLQGFTSISELLSPEDLTSLLNDYLSAMTDIIHEEGGTIDKYEGDAIIAFWNAPLAQEDHALRAVRAALRCQSQLSELRPAFRQRVGRELFMRVGLNSGPAVVGNMGSRTRFDYTMLGDAVNLAARLEGINKQFGTYTMVSSAVLRLLAEGAFPARELARVAVVGRKEPVTVYEPMWPEEHAARRSLLSAFAEALQAFYAGRFLEAERLFGGIAPQDPPAAAYQRKCRELLAVAPEGPWDGVWVMTSK